MSNRFKSEIRAFWKLSHGVRALMAALAVAGCMGVAASLLFIWTTKAIVDAAVSPEHSIPAWLIALLCACLVVQLLLPALRRRIEAVASTKFGNSLRSRLFHTLICARWVGRAEMHTADAINRMHEDVGTLSTLICSTIPGLAAVIFQLAGAFAFLAILNTRLALAVVLIMPLALIVSKLYFKKTRSITAAIRAGQSQLHTFLQESLHHRTLLSTLTGSEPRDQALNDIQHDITAKVLRRANIAAFSNAAVTAGFMAGYAVTFLWSAYGLTSGAVTFGMMTAFLQLVAQVQRPVLDISHRLPQFINASVALERISAITSLQTDEIDAESRVQTNTVGINLKNVSFTYPDGEDTAVLANLNHTFAPGSITAITGHTGAGKTTILRLLLGLIKPTTGGIYVCSGADEHPLTAAIRQNTVYVPQGNTLLQGTVRQNLLLGKPEASETEMKRALHAAAADFVFDLPEGLDTLCTEGGTGFSEGQAQRIALARGLLKGGRLVLLDEPTSALDPETEHTLLERLRKHLPAETTVIIVTHRPAVLAYCTHTLQL